MTPFTPSQTYEGLLRQAHALHTLASSQERRITLLNAEMDKLTRDYAAIGQEEVNAERDINAQLTDYVQQLECALEGVVTQRNHLLEMVKKWCPTEHPDFSVVQMIADDSGTQRTCQ